jgi:hypothetical protein
MARQSLGDLLARVEDSASETRPDLVPMISPEPHPEDKSESPRPPATARASKPAPDAASSSHERVVVEGLPRYLRFVRKETRLREDQQNQLTLHARRLTRRRTSGSPRITDNTLIRIAVDLLLERIAGADGGDESALLASLSNPPGEANY